MTATTTPSCTRYQDIHSTIPLAPTRCHPTAHSHLAPALDATAVLAAAQWCTWALTQFLRGDEFREVPQNRPRRV
ncbi:hypothetical protein ACWFQ8_18105 [Streptomyces sp. NPDC055254]